MSASTSGAAAPLDALASVFDEWKYGASRNNSIVLSSSAIVSVVASALLIWIIFRSRHGIATTYHRLLLGLSVSDFLFSFSSATFGAAVPSELNYVVWNARGSRVTCDVFGFLASLGAFSGLLYMCSLNLYYLAKVRFNRTDSYIAKRLEPWLHLVPVSFGAVVSVVFLAMGGMNADILGVCSSAYTYDPPHCDGYEDGDAPEGFEIPCGRGRRVEPIYYVTGFVTAFLVPNTISGSLYMIYKEVKTAEQRIARYGAGALQANADHPEGADGTTGSRSRRFSIASSMSSRFGVSSSRRSSNSTSAHQDSSQSRAVLQRAAAYSVAYVVTWIWLIINGFLILIGAWTTDLPQPKWQIYYTYVLNFFTPLQGLWTLLIYLQPNVVKRKRSRPNLSWSRAFADTLRSAITGRAPSAGRRGSNRFRSMIAGPGTPRPNTNAAPAPPKRVSSATVGSTVGASDRQGNCAGAESVGPNAEDPEDPQKRVSSSTAGSTVESAERRGDRAGAEPAGHETEDPEDPQKRVSSSTAGSTIGSTERQGNYAGHETEDPEEEKGEAREREPSV